MLKGIPHVLSPELLKALADMGHGDEIVIGDCNFPAASLGENVIRADGVKATDLLDGILTLLPLDTFVESPVALMEVIPGTFDGEPPIWSKFKDIISKHESNIAIEQVERFKFYERAKNAFAIVQSGEKALYACIILKKGVLLD